MTNAVKNMLAIEQSIFQHSEKNPSKYALISDKQKMTYAELVNQVDYIVKLLTNQYGIQSGDKIVLAAHKQHEFITSYLATHLTGAVAIILDYETSSNRLDFIIEKTKPKLILGKFKYLQDNSNDNFYQLILEGKYISNNTIEFNYPNFDINNTADILFTSGTTGLPKGIQLTNKNIAAAANNINTFIGIEETDVELLALPISHSFGLGRVRCLLAKGATIVLSNGFTNVKRYFANILEHSVTGLAFVPSAWAYLYKMSGERISEFKNQIRYVELGSAPMSIDEKEFLKSLLPNSKICMHYGLTEASRSTFLDFSEKTKLHTIGKASPNVDIKIVDKQGKELQRKEVGEIIVKGDHICSTFFDEQNNNIDNYFGEYIRTGDSGFMDEDGYISLAGREVELINVGGKKVYPQEIETILNSIEHIAESACVGVPDENGVLGEVVKAYLVGDESKVDIQNIKSIVQAQLESYKWPSSYDWINELPKTESGKIQRLKLK